MIDLHAHILPGVDDGARTVEEAREIGLAAAADGITAIVATPHVREDYPTTPGTMERSVAALRQDFTRRGIPVDVLTGGEVSTSTLWDLSPEDLTRFTLGGTGVYLLLECPYSGWPPALDLAVSKLVGSGLRPVLGHPERNPEVQDRPDRLAAFVEMGGIVQVTAASVVGRMGPAPMRTVMRLLELGAVHVIASDVHGSHIRDGGLSAAAEVLESAELARYLTTDAPGAIVAGLPLPSLSGAGQVATEDSADGHLLFVPHGDGYEIVPCAGAPPRVGERIEVTGHEGERFVVVRIGRSLYPDDLRPCVYVAGV